MKAKAVVALLAVGLFIFGMAFSADAALTTQTVMNDVATAPTRKADDNDATNDVTYGGATLGREADTGPVSVLRVVLKSDLADESIETVKVDVQVGVADVADASALSGYVDIGIYKDDGDDAFNGNTDTEVATSGGVIKAPTREGATGPYTVSISAIPAADLPVHTETLTLFIVATGGASLSDGHQFTISTDLSDWVFNKDSAGTKTATSGTITGDVTAPTIADGNVVTLDDDSDGLLDGVQITWSEEIADVSFTNFSSATASFAVTDGTEVGAYENLQIAQDGPPRTPDTIDNNVTFITFDEQVTLGTKTLDQLDTEGTPTLRMAQATLTDFAGNPIGAVTSTSVDKAPPVIFQSLYLDADDNGRIDEVQVQFSENIDDATFGNNNGWTVAGFNFKDVATDPPVLMSAVSSADAPTIPTGGTTDVLKLLLEEKTDFSTGIDLAGDQVTYRATVGDVADLSTNELNSVFVGTAPEVDRASPILIDAKTGDIIATRPRGQIDRYEIKFSEPVEARGEEADFILLDDFAVDSLNGNLTNTLTLVIRERGFIDTGVTPGLGVNTDIDTSPNAGIVDLAKDRLGANAPNGLVAPSLNIIAGAVTFNLVPDAKRLDGRSAPDKEGCCDHGRQQQRWQARSATCGVY